MSGGGWGALTLFISGKGNVKLGPLAFLANAPDTAVLNFHQVLEDGQPEANAGHTGRGCVAGSEELLEYLLLILFADANAIVLNRDPDVFS